MPNWCCGDLKIRGHIDDVHKLLDHLIYKKGKVIRDNDSIELQEVSGHLKDTHRCFVDGVSYTQDFYAKDDGRIIVIIPTEHAWCPRVEHFKELSQKFNVDFRFYGYEMGQQFNCEFEILKGELTLEKFIKFYDYQWECPRPLDGG